LNLLQRFNFPLAPGQQSQLFIRTTVTLQVNQLATSSPFIGSVTCLGASTAACCRCLVGHGIQIACLFMADSGVVPGRAAVRAALAAPDERERGLIVCALANACSLENAFGEEYRNFYPHVCIAEVRSMPGSYQQPAAPSDQDHSPDCLLLRGRYRCALNGIAADLSNASEVIVGSPDFATPFQT
jgi:hypothetical protein